MKSFLLSAVLLLSVACLQAQTVDEIVAKHIAAIGGKEKLSQIKSLYMENSVNVMGGDNPSTVTVLNGKGYRTEVEFQGQKIITVVSDKGGWAINPMAGSSDPTPLPDDQYQTMKDQIFIGAPFYEYAAKGTKLELVGKEEGAFKIKTGAGTSETSYFIDPTTYYITKLVRKGQMMGQEVEMTISFSDYKKTDFGYVIPYTVATDFGGQFQMTSTTKKAEINKEVDPKVFEMPAK